MYNIVKATPPHLVPANQPRHPQGQMVPRGQQVNWVPAEVVSEQPDPQYWSGQYQEPEYPDPYYLDPQGQPPRDPRYSQAVSGHLVHPNQRQVPSMAHQLLPPDIAAVIAQMSAQSDQARGLEQQQNYTYIDPQGRQVQGTISTQAWMVPVHTPNSSPQAQFSHSPSQPQSYPERGGGPTWQQVGFLFMFSGLALIILLLSFGLTNSQSYNNGMERANTTIRQSSYP